MRRFRTHLLPPTAVIALGALACRDASAPTAAPPADPRSTPVQSTGPASAAAARAPVVPGAPRRISAEAVAREIAEKRRAAEPEDLRDVARYIRDFDQARTLRGLQHLAAMAASVLHHERGPRADRLRRRLGRAYARTQSGVTATGVFGFTGPGACNIAFDEPAVLTLMADKAQGIFSSPPHWSQPCGAGGARVLVEPTVFNHYHLNYEDPTVDCIDVVNTGRYGRGPDSYHCVPLADPAQEPRYVGTHLGAEVLRVRRRAGNVERSFTLHTFAVVADVPVKVRYRTAGGGWFQWDSLPGNRVYDVSAYAQGVVEVQITHPGTGTNCGPDWKTTTNAACPDGTSPVFIDDLAITP